MILTRSQLETPVTVIFFRRPDALRSVMERVREVRPRSLYLVADGPREHVEGEAALCAETRDVAEALVDWPCTVHRNYAAANMGCGPRPASGISWVLQQEPATIILEDDCVAEPTFFHFCQELLARYANDERVAQVCGSSFHPELLDPRYSYGYSRYPLCWGWATWRRAWQHFDYSMSHWPASRADGMVAKILENPGDRAYWDRHFQRIYEGDDTVWDMRWTYAVWRERMVTIVPRTNLVTNVGFGTNSTHTSDTCSGGNVPSAPIEFPLRHPPVVLRAEDHDNLIEKTLFVKGGYWGATKQLVKQCLPASVLRALRNLKLNGPRALLAS